MNTIAIDELQDFSLRLYELKVIIDELIDKYGSGVTIAIDSAPYNASVVIKL